MMLPDSADKDRSGRPPVGAEDADQIVLLQQEIDFLGKVITRKDEALEEIRHFFHPKDKSQTLTAASIIAKSLSESVYPAQKDNTSAEEEKMSRELSEAVTDILSRSHSSIAEITQKYQLSKLSKSGVVAKGRKKRGESIIEVPVEMIPMTDSTDTSVQVDLFLSQENSQMEGEGENALLSEDGVMLDERPVVMSRVIEVPVEMYLMGEDPSVMERAVVFKDEVESTLPPSLKEVRSLRGEKLEMLYSRQASDQWSRVSKQQKLELLYLRGQVEQLRKLVQVGEKNFQGQAIGVQTDSKLFPRLIEVPIELQMIDDDALTEGSEEEKLADVKLQGENGEASEMGLVQMPTEVIVEKDMLVQVPVEVFVEKQVQVILEKTVHMMHQVPVETIVYKEVPILIEIPTQMYIPQPYIQQVPTQLIVPEITPVVHEVPTQCIVYEHVQVPIVQSQGKAIEFDPVEVTPAEQVLIKLESQPEVKQKVQIDQEVKQEQLPQIKSEQPNSLQGVKAQTQTQSANVRSQKVAQQELECRGEFKEQPTKAIVQGMIEVPVEVVLMEILQVPVEVFIAQMGPDSIKQPTLQVPVDILLNKTNNLPAEIVMKEKLSDKQQPSVEQEGQALRKSSSVKSEQKHEKEEDQAVALKSEREVVYVDRVVEKVVELPKQVVVQKEVIREVEKEVIREVEKEVIKEVEKQVIKEVIVEREVLIEVPVEVNIQKEIIIQKEVIVEKEVFKPIEVIKEVVTPVEVFRQTMIEVPLEMTIQAEFDSPQTIQLQSQSPADQVNDKQAIVEKQVLVEVPVEVIVEKEVIVYKQIMVQVPVQVISEKQISVQKQVMVELPVQVLVEKEVTVQKQIMVEVPVEVQIQSEPVVIEKVCTVEVEKVITNTAELVIQRDRIIQVPVQIILDEQPLSPLNDLNPFNLVSPSIKLQPPAEAIVLRSQNSPPKDSLEYSLSEQAPLYGSTKMEKEVPMQEVVQVQKIVYVDRVVEVAVPIILPEDQSPQPQVVQKIVYVEVEVPVEVYIEKQVPAPIDWASQVIEVPVEMAVEPLVNPQPIYAPIPQIVQVPVEIKMPAPALKLNLPPNVTYQQSSPATNSSQEQPVKTLQLSPTKSEPDDNTLIYEFPLKELPEYGAIEILTNQDFGPGEEIILDIPYHRQSAETETQTLLEVVQRIHSNEEARDEADITLNTGKRPRGQRSKMEEGQQEEETVRELEERIMWMQEQHQNRLSDMKELYKEEIKHLMEGHGSLQKLATQKDRDIEQLHDRLEKQALDEEELRTQIEKQAIQINELEQQVERLAKENKSLSDNKQICFVEVPVEIQVKDKQLKEGSQQIQMIEVPVQVNLRANFDQTEVQIEVPSEEDQVQAQEHVHELRGPQKKVSKESKADHYGRRDPSRNQSYSYLPNQTRMDHDETQRAGSEFYRSQVDPTSHRMYSGIIENNITMTENNNYLEGTEQYEAMLNQMSVFEVPVEIVAEPIIYEIAVPVTIVKDTQEVEAQTGSELLPVREVEVIKEIAPIQPPKQQESSFFFSRFIEIPIEVEMQKNSREFREFGVQSEIMIPQELIVPLAQVLPKAQMFSKNKVPITIDTFTGQQEEPHEPHHNNKLISIEQDLRPFQDDEPGKLQAAIGPSSLPDQHNLTNSREVMKIDVTDPMIRFELQEAVEEKQHYQQLYDEATANKEQAKREVKEKEDELEQMKAYWDGQREEHEDSMRQFRNNISQLNKLNEEQLEEIQALKAQKEQYMAQKAKNEQALEKYQEQLELLKQKSQSNARSLEKQIDELKGLIEDKVAQIKDMKAEERQQKREFQAQEQQYRNMLEDKQKMLAEAEEELHRANDKIDHYAQNQEELRKNIMLLQQNQEVNNTAIYEQEFERVKEHFEQQRQQDMQNLSSLEQQVEELTLTVAQQKEAVRTHEETITHLEEQLAEAKEEYSKLHHVKSDLQNNYVENIQDANRELDQMRELVREKDHIIKSQTHIGGELPIALHSSRPAQPVPSASSDLPSVRMEYLSTKTSRAEDNSESLSQGMYVRKLEALVIRYEKALGFGQVSYAELQEKVYEYLHDALIKQQEVEALSDKLGEYETTINSILVEKVSYEIENRQLKKTLEMSEKQLMILGNKLIKATNRRNELESELSQSRESS